MAKTLEKIFEQKLQTMPPEECEVDPNQKGKKKPPRKQKGMWPCNMFVEICLILCFLRYCSHTYRLLADCCHDNHTGRYNLTSRHTQPVPTGFNRTLHADHQYHIQSRSDRWAVHPEFLCDDHHVSFQFNAFSCSTTYCNQGTFGIR